MYKKINSVEKLRPLHIFLFSSLHLRKQHSVLMLKLQAQGKQMAGREMASQGCDRILCNNIKLLKLIVFKYGECHFMLMTNIEWQTKGGNLHKHGEYCLQPLNSIFKSISTPLHNTGLEVMCNLKFTGIKWKMNWHLISLNLLGYKRANEFLDKLIKICVKKSCVCIVVKLTARLIES